MDKIDRLERQLQEINRTLVKIAKELRIQNIALNERRKEDGRDETEGILEETV